MTQPPLSISIRNLESTLGGKLFVRDNRKTELTELGEAMVEPARRALQAMEEVGSVSQLMATGEVGRLAISYPNGATHRLLPQVLPDYIRQFPRVDLRLIEATSAETVRMLDEGTVDIGIIYYPISGDREYIPIPGENDELVAVFPRGYPLSRKKAIQLADLASHPFIAFTQTAVPTLPVVISMACQRAGFVPAIAHYAARVETVISLVRSGVGVSLVPRICAQTYSHVIDMRPIIDYSAALQIGLGVIAQNSIGNPRAVNFLKMLDVEIT